MRMGIGRSRSLLSLTRHTGLSLAETLIIEAASQATQQQRQQTVHFHPGQRSVLPTSTACLQPSVGGRGLLAVNTRAASGTAGLVGRVTTLVRMGAGMSDETMSMGRLLDALIATCKELDRADDDSPNGVARARYFWVESLACSMPLCADVYGACYCERGTAAHAARCEDVDAAMHAALEDAREVFVLDEASTKFRVVQQPSVTPSVHHTMAATRAVW